MLLNHEQQVETLHAAAREAGVEIERDDVAWRDEAIDANGLRLHYLDWGTAGQPPMLLLHGGMQTAHSWDIAALAMKRRYHVVAPDLRGHGDSDWSDAGDYGHATHAADVRAIMRHLGWERCVLIGLSLGGMTALRLAADGDTPLDALVIVDVGPELNPRGVGRITEFRRAPGELDSVDEFIERAVAYNPRRRAEQLRYSLTHNLRRLASGKYTWKYDRRIGERGQTGPRRFDELWDALGQIRCPTLVVRGAQSDIFAEETGRRMVDLIPDARFVTVPDAGHTVPQDNPAGFLAVVEPFLEEHRASS